MSNVFPPGFRWGAATSAHQTEGGNVNSDWWRLEHAQPSLMAESSGDACDSFHRYPEDFDLVAAAGLNTYRFSIEWARIEPAQGEFSAAAIAHYQRMIDGCREREIEPIITLHHFTNPAWLRQSGSWTSDAVVDSFKRYVDHALSQLRDVGIVCTINEPNMISTFAGLLAHGGEAKPDPVINARLAAAHRHAVDAARAAGARAGLTLAMTGYETDGSPEADALIAAHRAADEDFFIEAARADDFLGVQAYSTRFVTAAEILPFGQGFDGPYEPCTMMGWSYTPDTIGKCVRRAHELAGELPLFVTENGIATADDEQRISYTDGALRSLLAAIEDGVPVEGYLHWSLLDNFEWPHGFRPTFGLVAVDRVSFERTPKPSLGWLGRVAKANCLP